MSRSISLATFGLVAGLALAGMPSRARAQSSEAAAIAQARLDSIRRPYTAADIAFMTGMIYHHSQAVKMAGWAASHGASPAVQVFCGRIAMGQTAEIGIMQAWLRARNQPVPEPDPEGMKMSMNGSTQTMLMPGMLTPAQMHELDNARGTAFDRLFLTFMIQHHKGALTMVDTLFNSPGAGQDELVFKFATNVHADQTTEIERMESMLNDIFAAAGSDE
ncbi:MAG: DUF305 domain-containing protein [Gemmatimonadales bacterium]